MSLLIYKAIAGLLIFITSLVAVIYPIKVRAHPQHHLLLEIGDAFASGIFLGAALFHMLPDSIRDFAAIYGNNDYPLAELFCAVGFLILLFLERLSENGAEENSTNAIPYMLAVILIIHALIEGAVLGINTTLATAAVIFVAIIAHKSSESFALAVILNRNQIALKQIIIIVGLFSLMTPIGILFGASLASNLPLNEEHFLIAAFNAFAAGTFLYMSTLHHINHHQRSHKGEGLIEFFALLMGLSVMGVIALWA